MIRTLTTAIAAFAVASSTFAQDLLPKAAPQTQPILITGRDGSPTRPPASQSQIGAVLLSSKNIETGYVTFLPTNHPLRPGRTNPRQNNLEVIDAAGLHVYPGLIGANTVTGLVEIASVDVTVDTNEQGTITPEARAIAAVNPDSTLIPVTRAAGILTTGVMPSGGVVPGRAAVISMDGWTWEDMAVSGDAGLIIAWPNLLPRTAWWITKSVDEQKAESKENRQRIIDLFDAATAYHAARAADPTIPTDLRYEAMRPSLTGEKPVFVQAQELEQIMDAVSVCASRGMNVVIVGGRDSHLCTDHLKAHNATVMITGTHRLPRRSDSYYDEPFTLPAKLEAAGVTWCLATAGGSVQPPHERQLPYHAATAVAYGLDHDAALRSITLSAAEVLGVANQLGSLEPGKRATLIITTGDPLEITTEITAAYIDGKSIDLRSKHTELYKKYREKYKQLGIIND